MKRLLDYDPLTGIKEIFHHDDKTGEWAIEMQQDISAQLEAAKDMRNDPNISKKGIKDGMWHYAHMPNIIVQKMISEDGVNPYDQNNATKVGKLIDEKYPYLKVTGGHHKFKT